jgi:hypothetical protein
MTFKNSSEKSKLIGHWVAGKPFDGTLIYNNGDSF